MLKNLILVVLGAVFGAAGMHLWTSHRQSQGTTGQDQADVIRSVEAACRGETGGGRFPKPEPVVKFHPGSATADQEVIESIKTLFRDMHALGVRLDFDHKLELLRQPLDIRQLPADPDLSKALAAAGQTRAVVGEFHRGVEGLLDQHKARMAQIKAGHPGREDVFVPADAELREVDRMLRRSGELMIEMSDTVREILEMLRDNKGLWVVDNGRLVIKDPDFNSRYQGAAQRLSTAIAQWDVISNPPTRGRITIEPCPPAGSPPDGPATAKP